MNIAELRAVDAVSPVHTGCGTLTVHELTPDASGRWDSYVRASPAGTFCHLTAWTRIVEATWGHRSLCMYAERDGRVVGVLPLFFVRSLFGRTLVSTPNAVYGGIAADDVQAHGALLERARHYAEKLRVQYLELREWRVDPGLPSYPGLHVKDLYVSFDHPLTTNEDALLKSFPRDIRRMARLGAKNGLTSVVGSDELLDELYDAYAVSVRSLGTPVFPKRLFAACLREFRGDVDILAVRHGNRTAGVVLSFYFRDTVYPYYAGAYPEFYKAGVNNFMYWELMRHAAARGCTRFDFGRSKRGTGAYAFKRGWGMTEHPLPYSYLLVNAQKMPDLNPANASFKPLIAIWQRLPLGVTKLLGPIVVRNLP